MVGNWTSSGTTAPSVLLQAPCLCRRPARGDDRPPNIRADRTPRLRRRPTSPSFPLTPGHRSSRPPPTRRRSSSIGRGRTPVGEWTPPGCAASRGLSASPRRRRSRASSCRRRCRRRAWATADRPRRKSPSCLEVSDAISSAATSNDDDF